MGGRIGEAPGGQHGSPPADENNEPGGHGGDTEDSDRDSEHEGQVEFGAGGCLCDIVVPRVEWVEVWPDDGGNGDSGSGYGGRHGVCAAFTVGNGGCAQGGDCWSGPGGGSGGDCGSGSGSDCGGDCGGDCGNDSGGDCGNDCGSDCGSDCGTDPGNGSGPGVGRDCGGRRERPECCGRVREGRAGRRSGTGDGCSAEYAELPGGLKGSSALTALRHSSRLPTTSARNSSRSAVRRPERAHRDVTAELREPRHGSGPVLAFDGGIRRCRLARVRGHSVVL